MGVRSVISVADPLAIAPFHRLLGGYRDGAGDQPMRTSDAVSTDNATAANLR